VSFRKNWLPNLVTTFLLSPLLFKQQLQPWVENIISQPRDRLLRTVGWIIGVSVLLFGLLRARTLWSWVRSAVARRLRKRGAILPFSGSSVSATIDKAALTVAPPELPPGTASAIAMAMQPPAPRPRFVNSNDSAWLLQEYARQRAEGRFALAATQRAFSVALSVPPAPPSAPTTFVLH
jgi:hypothetical protein